MMHTMLKILGLVFLCHLILAQSPQIIRGPYLQSVTPNSGIIRWRTDIPSSSQVFWVKIYLICNKRSLTINKLQNTW